MSYGTDRGRFIGSDVDGYMSEKPGSRGEPSGVEARELSFEYDRLRLGT